MGERIIDTLDEFEPRPFEREGTPNGNQIRAGYKNAARSRARSLQPASLRKRMFRHAGTVARRQKITLPATSLREAD